MTTSDETDEAIPIDAARVVRAATITAAVIVAVYVFRTPATPYLLDSSELVATTAALGVSHPPGHPSFHMLGVGWLSAPVSTIAFRLHAFVAFTSALCLALLPIAGYRLGWIRTRAHLTFASLLTVGLAFAPAFAQQSIRAEVYALNALVLAGATVLALRPERTGTIGAAIATATALGIGLLNHHFLVIVAFPAFAWAIVTLATPGSATRRVVAGALTGASALLGYGYLVARSSAQPAASWGWPDSFADVMWIVSAQAFQKTAANVQTIDPSESLINIIGVLGESLTLPGFLLAIVGLVLLTLRHKRVGVFLLLAIGCNLMTQVSFGFDPLNPDALGYFMPSYWWLGLALVFLVCHVELPGQLARRTGLLQVSFGVLLLLGIALTARAGTRAVTLADYWDSEYLRDEALNGLAPSSTWLTTYYETGFNTWYAQAVEDRRPDVTHVHLAFLTYPFYAEMLEARGAEEIVAAADSDALVSVAELRRRARTSEVRMEAEALVPPDLSAQSVPVRLYLQLVTPGLPDGPFPESLAQESVSYAAAAAERFSRPLETQTARNLVWAYYNLAGHMFRAGRIETSRGIIGEALKLSPNDPDLRAAAAQMNRASTAN